MTHRNTTRRRFLKTSGAAASVAFLGPSLFDLGCAPSSFIRRDVGGLDASSPIIQSYAKAVKAMQLLPATDQRSWSYQAAIHGTYTTPVKTAWNTCEHGSYHFWSWHRMYLYYFERIVRKISGDSSFALPFWNWTEAAERKLPDMFRNPANSSNALWVSDRDPSMNDGSGELPAPDVDYSAAFSLVDFTSASALIQGTPHGDVHIDVGGWMGDVPTAAQDPIFYLHHCNMDRLWNLWLAQGGGRTDPLGDSVWKNTKFTFFDENGAPVQLTGCDILQAQGQLKYVYEGEPAQVKLSCLKIIKPPYVFIKELIIHFPIPPIVLGAEPVSATIDITEVLQRLAAIANNETQTIFLELDDVEAEKQPGIHWDVYLGLTAEAKPDLKSPNRIGSLVLFGTGVRSETQHEFRPAKFSFPVNRVVNALVSGETRQIPLTLVPRGILRDGKLTTPRPRAQVRIGSVSLSVLSRKEQ